MDASSLEQKQQLFGQFFRIAYPIQVNVLPLAENTQLPDVDDLSEHMPMAFRVATEGAELDSKMLSSLRVLGDKAQELTQYLHHQAHKINLLMSLVLQQQDDPAQRYQCLEFGGSGIIISVQDALPVGTVAEIKVFLTNEASAVFCYGEVIESVAGAQGFVTSLVFTRIREQDQDLIVRASLHLQTKQLRKRNQPKSNEQ